MPARSQERGRMTAAAMAVALLCGCSAGGDGGAADSSTLTRAPAAEPDGRLPRPDHVVVAIFENKETGQVLGSGRAPWLDSLARSGATLTDSHAVTHPSQPNYVALFSGSTHGVTDDRCPLELSGDNLAAQLAAAGRSFVGYSEDLPAPGFTGCSSGGYRRKHNPWVDFTALPPSVNQPLSSLPDDFAQLPTVAFVVPDLCHDMHDCDVPTGDAWARDHLAPYAAWATDHDSLLVVTFDEDDGSSDNHIATIVSGAGVATTTDDQRTDHYGLLRTLEDMYGLPAIGEAVDASPLTGIWTAPGG